MENIIGKTWFLFCLVFFRAAFYSVPFYMVSFSLFCSASTRKCDALWRFVLYIQFVVVIFVVAWRWPHFEWILFFFLCRKRLVFVYCKPSVSVLFLFWHYLYDLIKIFSVFVFLLSSLPIRPSKLKWFLCFTCNAINVLLACAFNRNVIETKQYKNREEEERKWREIIRRRWNKRIESTREKKAKAYEITRDDAKMHSKMMLNCYGLKHKD